MDAQPAGGPVETEPTDAAPPGTIDVHAPEPPGEAPAPKRHYSPVGLVVLAASVITSGILLHLNPLQWGLLIGGTVCLTLLALALAPSVLEWLVLLVTAVAIAIIIKTFLVQAFYIPSGSMLPTLQENDRVLVNKLSYKMHDVHRGDIVVFEAPPGMEQRDIKDLVKRVVGLPGDDVSLHDGQVYINGKALDEDYLPGGPAQTPSEACSGHTETDWKIPDNAIFVMGDNRTASQDSR
ncbi:MAG TPA: signal peptidase I, partial [Acidimicrobiia bacterium]|nr:signal peptidase I [Acidimicrobiia bacterium]